MFPFWFFFIIKVKEQNRGEKFMRKKIKSNQIRTRTMKKHIQKSMELVKHVALLPVY